MSLIPYSFRDVHRFFEEDWPEIWRDKTSDWKLSAVRIPRMDVYEDNGNVVAEIELPGVDPKKIELEVEKNLLTVEAVMAEKKEEKRRGYYRKELSHSCYKRAMSLPVEVVGDKAEASYEEGVLRVVIPKAKVEKTKKKKIEIKTKSKK